jgi:hypothetical protein
MAVPNHGHSVAAGAWRAEVLRAATPARLDLRRQLGVAKRVISDLRARERAAEARAAVLAGDLAIERHQRTELHVAYVELLAHARAAVAAQRAGELGALVYVQGHLEEIGLLPPHGASARAIVAEVQALVARLEGSA